MKRLLLKVFSLLLILFTFASCGTPEQSPSESSGPQPAPSPQPAPVVEPVKNPEPSVPFISDVDVNQMYSLSQPYVEYNFYFGTPQADLDPDWGEVDSNYANPSKIYHSISEYKEHMKRDFNLSEGFANHLIDRMSNMLYEHDGYLYVIAANRGSDITVGNEIDRSIIREGDSKVILRVSHETIDDTSGETKVLGSFTVDNVLIYEDGKWVWDDIPEYR